MDWIKKKMKKNDEGGSGMEWLTKMFKKSDDGGLGSGSELGKDDPLLWYRDLEKHAYGKYSYAAVNVREAGEREEYSQIVPGPEAVVVLFFSHTKFYWKSRDEFYTVRAFVGRDGVANLKFN